MPRPVQEILQEAGAFIDANPGLFNGVAPGNIIPHLGVVNPNLWNQLAESYRASGGQSFNDAVAQGAAAGLIGGPFGVPIGAAVGGGMQLAGAGAPTLNEWALANPAVGQGLLRREPPPPAAQPVAPKTLDQQGNSAAVQAEVGKRTNANLQSQLESIFGGVESATTNKINDQYAQQRSKQVAEEGALGRLTSPNSIIPLSQIDRNQGFALSDAIGQIQAQKATGQLDVSKAIENILQGQRGLDQSSDQFGQTLGFNRDSLLNDINQRRELMGLQRETNSKPGTDKGGDMIGGGIAGGLAGAKVGSAAGPWGSVIGGLGGAGLGAYSESRKNK